MPSTALLDWQNDRTPRLNEVEAHCASVVAQVPPNPPFLDETLRGYVLHLSAHFQGFCRDLYAECTQVWIKAIPPNLKITAQMQFMSQLSLEKGNPSYDNIRQDFNRFGFLIDLQAAHPQGPQQITDLNHINTWRNKAAHQGKRPLPVGIPTALTLPILQGWKATCDALATSLDGVVKAQLSNIMGVAPW